MKQVAVFLLVAASMLPAVARPQERATARPVCTAAAPGAEWKKVASPEAAGWSKEKLDAAKAFARQIGSMSWMLVQGGRVVDDFGPVEELNSLHSARKSVVSALYGLAVQEGKVRLGSTLAELGVDDDDPALTPEEKKATVRDLLMARSGVYHRALGVSPRVKEDRQARGSHAPATFWYYNNWDFNALGTILHKATGQSPFDYFRDRIAAPLQMQDYRADEQEYVAGEESRHRYYDFRLSARDMARFGHLYLREGCWNGTQVVPAQWVTETTRASSDTGSDVLTKGIGYYGYMWWDYGYVWWVAKDGRFLPGAHLPDGSFAALGVGPQVILVVPQRNLVFVHRTDTKRKGAKLIPMGEVGELIDLVLAAAPAGRSKNGN